MFLIIVTIRLIAILICTFSLDCCIFVYQFQDDIFLTKPAGIYFCYHYFLHCYYDCNISFALFFFYLFVLSNS